MLEELGRHGYKISAGTLYAILHGLEAKGYLHSRETRHGKSRRRVYRALIDERSLLLHCFEVGSPVLKLVINADFGRLSVGS
jgi:Fe2+ or Zn2+ uptake regulation protein